MKYERTKSIIKKRKINDSAVIQEEWVESLWCIKRERDSGKMKL